MWNMPPFNTNSLFKWCEVLRKGVPRGTFPRGLRLRLFSPSTYRAAGARRFTWNLSKSLNRFRSIASDLVPRGTSGADPLVRLIQLEGTKSTKSGVRADITQWNCQSLNPIVASSGRIWNGVQKIPGRLQEVLIFQVVAPTLGTVRVPTSR